jgi:hypothetical protein
MRIAACQLHALHAARKEAAGARCHYFAAQATQGADRHGSINFELLASALAGRICMVPRLSINLDGLLCLKCEQASELSAFRAS